MNDGKWNMIYDISSSKGVGEFIFDHSAINKLFEASKKVLGSYESTSYFDNLEKRLIIEPEEDAFIKKEEMTL